MVRPKLVNRRSAAYQQQALFMLVDAGKKKKVCKLFVRGMFWPATETVSETLWAVIDFLWTSSADRYAVDSGNDNWILF